MDNRIVMFCLCALIAILVIPSVSFAASFDCSKASTKTEKAICNDPILSKLDEDIAVAYRKALKTSDRDAVKKEQRRWLKEKLVPCIEDKACIKEAYENRLRQLGYGTESQKAVAIGDEEQESTEVRYTCNKNIGAIEIHLSKFDSCLEIDRSTWQGEAVPWERTQTIETIREAGSPEYDLRKAAKPVKYECTLTSGKYVISFGSFWLNANVEGADGMDSWPTVKINREKETVLPTTILGTCDAGRSGLGNCEKEWAIRIFLFHSGDKPCVTADRFTKDWVR